VTAGPTAPPAPPLVLVVDDSPLVTEALGALLDAVGYRSAAAHTVGDAVRVAHAVRPDAMLLDLTLPDGDGLEVLAALGPGRAMVALALTGHDDPATAARCRAAGCRTVLSKPVRAADLVRALAEAGVGVAGAAPTDGAPDPA
jgi:CheY-like chemotaxis protein